MWEDENALTEFIQNLPHSQVMVALRLHLDKTKFVQWEITGSAAHQPGKKPSNAWKRNNANSPLYMRSHELISSSYHSNLFL